MGRLTYRNSTGRAFINHTYFNWEDGVAYKLACYEDLEEQGRLYVLPCGIGKPLYVIQGQIKNWDEESLTFSVKHIIRTVTPNTVEGCMVWKDDIEHERAFLTKEEAERKLAELNNESE